MVSLFLPNFTAGFAQTASNGLLNDRERRNVVADKAIPDTCDLLFVDGAEAGIWYSPGVNQTRRWLV
jgi:hypothetical protein